jgi:ABC-type amino acid transport substrate-binding protein
MMKKIFVVFLLSFFVSKWAFSKEYAEMQVCSEAGFFPFEMRTQTGKWDGYDIALIQRFAKETGRKITMVDMKFDGLIPALIANKGCDVIVSAVGINEERKKIVLFSYSTYQSAYAGIIRVEDAEKYKTFENMNQTGVNIAVQSGTEASQYVKKNFNKAHILTYDDNSVPINAVITKKADLYIDDSVYSMIAVKRKVGRLALIEPEAFPKNKYGGMGFVFRKSDTHFRDEFDQFFDKIKKNGELKKLQDDYFEKMIWMKDFP